MLIRWPACRPRRVGWSKGPLIGLPHARGRIDGIYMKFVFLGGPAASAMASPSFVHGGRRLTCLCGAVLGLLALFATERRPSKPPAC